MSKLNPNDFTKPVKELLAKRVSYICSKCKRHTSGGNSNPQKATIIGEAAHIEGARPSDRRYNPRMTSEQRRDISNGIWLCGDCHKEVDDDPGQFTVEWLHNMKKDHEDSVLHSSFIGQGGRGGNASVSGNGTAIGGKGGAGGPGGKGGAGGDAHVDGEGFSMGGEGGEAGQQDRGGKGGRGPLHVLMEDYPEKFKEIAQRFGVTEDMAKKIGKGGDGGYKKE
jgi:hypothetical protein